MCSNSLSAQLTLNERLSEEKANPLTGGGGERKMSFVVIREKFGNILVASFEVQLATVHVAEEVFASPLVRPCVCEVVVRVWRVGVCFPCLSVLCWEQSHFGFGMESRAREAPWSSLCRGQDAADQKSTREIPFSSQNWVAFVFATPGSCSFSEGVASMASFPLDVFFPLQL